MVFPLHTHRPHAKMPYMGLGLQASIAAILILQATPSVPGGFDDLKHIGSVSLAGLIFFFYRQDRKDSEKRIAEANSEYRDIVTENTAAVTNNANATAALTQAIRDISKR